jgi:hypothetical protein
VCLVDFQRKISFKIAEAPKGDRLGYIEVVADKNAHLTTTVEEILEMLKDVPSTAVEQKGYRNIADTCPVHMLDQVRQKWICVPLNKPLLIGSDWLYEIIRLSRNDVPDASTGIDNISCIAWDHMKMEVWDSLSGRRSKIKTYVETLG